MGSAQVSIVKQLAPFMLTVGALLLLDGWALL
jgi:hypothetical protein